MRPCCNILYQNDTVGVGVFVRFSVRARVALVHINEKWIRMEYFSPGGGGVVFGIFMRYLE